MATIDIKAITKKGMASRTAIRSSLSKATAVYEVEKEKLFNEIDTHPISQELRQNNSPGKYSLFGFLGFEEGRDPVDEVKNYIETATILDPTPITSENKIGYRVKIPSPNEVYDATKTLAWGFSWVYGIEKFIPGIEYFVWFRNKPAGRSGLGYQDKKETVTGSQPGTYIRARKYITTMLKSFAARLQFGRVGR